MRWRERELVNTLRAGPRDHHVGGRSGRWGRRQPPLGTPVRSWPALASGSPEATSIGAPLPLAVVRHRAHARRSPRHVESNGRVDESNNHSGSPPQKCDLTLAPVVRRTPSDIRPGNHPAPHAERKSQRGYGEPARYMSSAAEQCARQPPPGDHPDQTQQKPSEPRHHDDGLRDVNPPSQAIAALSRTLPPARSQGWV
jgi:hypothetical protein